MHIYVYVYSAMDERMKSHQLPPVLRAVADSTRLKILLMLEAKPRTVSQIVEIFELSQPTITRHLQTLANAGLVKRSRKGQHVYYELAVDKVRMMCSDLVACFPCCCVATESNTGRPIQVITITKRRPANTTRKKQSKPKKGESI